MGLFLTGTSCNRGNNSHSVWIKKPRDYHATKELGEGPYVTAKSSNSLVCKKSYEHLFVLGA